MKRWEELQNGVGVWVSEDHTLGTDTLLLARFAAHGKERVCELGCGCGTVSMLLAAQGAEVDAVEIQREAAALAAASVLENGFAERLRIHHADWNALHPLLPANAFDRVVCNPPYFKKGGGKAYESEARRIAREESGPEMLDELCAVAARLLRSGGIFSFCHRPERLCDLFWALRRHRLEPKRLRLVCHPEKTAPWLLLCDARRDGNPGLQVETVFDTPSVYNEG